MKRLAFLGVGSAIILGFGVMGASPAFADNGPHVSTGGSTTVDKCAACHRAHTAEASYLLTSDQTSLCESCHGAGATGAATDVMSGVDRNTAGALRGGGFEFALIGANAAVYSATAANKSIPVGASEAVTSTHDLGVAGTAWGGGASGQSGTSITLECGSCHDPHGNGNWRILRPIGEGGAALTFPATVGVSSVTQDSAVVGSRGTTYTYTIVTSAANTFKVTNPVTYVSSNGASFVNAMTVKTVNSPTSFTASVTLSADPGIGGASSGLIGYANPLGIAMATSDGTTHTYTTLNGHGLVTGSVVTITGMAPTGYNVSKAQVTVTGVNTFTVAPASLTPAATPVANGIASTAGGVISSGIPDGIGHTYTTTNYWRGDDHYYTGVNKSATLLTDATLTAANNGPTAYLANVSQWCATCHTRLLAGSGAWGVNSGDPMYTFEHRSQNGKEGSPNCIQCHVSHGSNAAATGGYSNAVGSEVLGAGHDGDSFLLRVDNRGTCAMCHNSM